MSLWLWIGIIVVSVAAAVVIAVWLTRKNDAKKVSYMMDALEYVEPYSRHFRTP